MTLNMGNAITCEWCAMSVGRKKVKFMFNKRSYLKEKYSK